MRPVALITLVLAGLAAGFPLSQHLRVIAAPAVEVVPIPSVSAPPVSVPPASPTSLSEELPEGAALHALLGERTTRYATYKRGRSRNVERAAVLLNDAIIAPGASLSFNETVGPRIRRNGFGRAPVIEGGELVQGMGGGVCQVASTFHAAALEAGLTIVDGRPHSRPSGYLPLGLDAAVSYPDLDLVVANPFEFPVHVRAVAEDGEVHVELSGASKPVEVEVSRRLLRRRSFEERIVEDPALPVGTREVSQEGIRGAHVEVTRRIVDAEANEVIIESEVVRYPPTHRIVRVGVAGSGTSTGAGAGNAMAAGPSTVAPAS